MNVREATTTDKDRWNHFVANNETGSFLQSWDWADFYATQKDKVWRLIVEDGEKWLATVFLFRSKLKLGQSILYASRGPVISDKFENEKARIMELIVRTVDALAARSGALHFQVDPYSSDKSWCAVFDRLGFVKAEKDSQPRHTLILDIREPEEKLLAEMHQKTRYNINLAAKKGVEIIVDNAAYKEFHELLKKTVDRQGIILYSADYFKKLLSLPFVKLYLAKYQGKIVAANIMIFWNHIATYLFGASDYEFRNLMAPHLLQWRAMKDAKDAGMWFYDFWGAAPRDAAGREANWSGFTKFKMGFSPEAEIAEYLGTYEKVYSPVRLRLYRFLQQRFRR